MSDVLAFIEKLGYSGVFLKNKELKPIVDFDPKIDQLVEKIGTNQYINNFIFLPKAGSVRIEHLT